jgi:hypothetical protein
MQRLYYSGVETVDYGNVPLSDSLEHISHRFYSQSEYGPNSGLPFGLNNFGYLDPNDYEQAIRRRQELRNKGIENLSESEQNEIATINSRLDISSKKWTGRKHTVH